MDPVASTVTCTACGAVLRFTHHDGTATVEEAKQLLLSVHVKHACRARKV